MPAWGSRLPRKSSTPCVDTRLSTSSGRATRTAPSWPVRAREPSSWPSPVSLTDAWRRPAGGSGLRFAGHIPRCFWTRLGSSLRMLGSRPPVPPSPIDLALSIVQQQSEPSRPHRAVSAHRRPSIAGGVRNARVARTGPDPDGGVRTVGSTPAFEPLQISAAARDLGISERTLQRTTASVVGMSPLHFINRFASTRQRSCCGTHRCRRTPLRPRLATATLERSVRWYASGETARSARCGRDDRQAASDGSSSTFCPTCQRVGSSLQQPHVDKSVERPSLIPLRGWGSSPSASPMLVIARMFGPLDPAWSTWFCCRRPCRAKSPGRTCVGRWSPTPSRYANFDDLDDFDSAAPGASAVAAGDLQPPHRSNEGQARLMLLALGVRVHAWDLITPSYGSGQAARYG